MQRACDVCGKAYQAKRSTSRYCSSSCRARATTEGKRAKKVAALPTPPVEAGVDTLLEATQRELEAAGRAESYLGRQALALAARIESPAETGSSVASLSKEFRAVMESALDGAAVAADPIDELRARREHKRNAG